MRTNEHAGASTAGFERGGQFARDVNRRGLALLGLGLALPTLAILLQLAGLALRADDELRAPAAASDLHVAGVFLSLRGAGR